MIPIKAGAKFTITTEIRDSSGNLKERTVEEAEVEEER